MFLNEITTHFKPESISVHEAEDATVRVHHMPSTVAAKEFFTIAFMGQDGLDQIDSRVVFFIHDREALIRLREEFDRGVDAALAESQSQAA